MVGQMISQWIDVIAIDINVECRVTSLTRRTAKVAETTQSNDSPTQGTSELPSLSRSASSQRWVPPNARERLNTSQQTFRKIRGILNKLTPDNFSRLSQELVYLASASNDREKLKGAILLVYDKAVDEPSYSSMYAQLCLRLSKYAPNFEDSGSKANTFWKLLLHKCQEEFDNRKQANEEFVGRNELSEEEEEQRSLAKRKMLGNIKFVGELFKLGMVHEAIIHSCIKELLEKKKGQSIDDICQNLECLCHCMTTVGQKLDTEKAKAWMDKYFARILSLSSNEELPPRIRFMLLDVTDLRKGNWSSHHATASSDKPRPIHEIRQEAFLLSSTPPPPLNISPFEGVQNPVKAAPPGASGDEGFVTSPLMDSPLSPQDTHSFVPYLHTAAHAHAPPKTLAVDLKLQSTQDKKCKRLPSAKRDDVVSLRPAISSLKLGSGSSRSLQNQPSSMKQPTSLEPKMQLHLPRTRDDSSDEEDSTHADVKGIPDASLYGVPVGVMSHTSSFPPRPHYPIGPPLHHFTHALRPQQNLYHHGQQPIRFPLPGSRGVPLQPPPQLPQVPHFRPLRPQHGPYYRTDTPQAFSPQVFPTRPPHDSMGPIHRPPPFITPDLPPSTLSYNGTGITSDFSRGLPPGLDRAESVPVRYASKSAGAKKSSGKSHTSQDDNEKAMESIMKKYLVSRDVDSAITAIKGLEKMSTVTVCTLLMSKTLEKSEDDRTQISDLVCELHSHHIISSEDFSKAFNGVLSANTSLEDSPSLYRTSMAGFAARAIAKGVVTLREVATTFDQGAHHPTMLVVLQALVAIIGEDKLYSLFSESKLTVTSLIPAELRSHESITEITESKKLGFLYPLRRIQAEVGSMLKSGTSAGGLYKWIEANVDRSLYSNPDFIMIITKIIIFHATCDTSLSQSVNHSLNPSSDVIGREKNLVEQYTKLMQKFVSDNLSLQIAVLYSTQVFCNDHNFPKGLILRLFSYWYEMDVVDGEALVQWRDDTSQAYPGKGKALFEVNHWLTLVEEAEEAQSSEED